jgi:nitrilase
VSSTRVAVVQAAPHLFDLPESLRRFESLLGEASAGGTGLVVFPEAFVGGYPKGATFGATVGERSAAGREWFARYRRGALELPGPAFTRIQRAVAGHGSHVVLGVVERAGGTLYCTALLLAPDGTLLGRHRKLVPTGIERLIWGRGGPADIAVIDTDVGRVGMAICWENYMPLYRAALYQRGVQLWCAPTVDARDSWSATMRHIAVEGRCYVLSANQFARGEDYPADFPPRHPPESVVIRGGSCVVDPYGEVLAGPCFDQPAVLTADIDLDTLDGAYLDLDVAGHYARPDLFELRVPGSAGAPG